MDDRTLRVLEFNSIREMLKEQAVCAQTRELCGALLPVENIYKARELLSYTSEAESLIIKKGTPPISPVINVLGAAKRSLAGGTLSMSELLSVAHTLRMARGLLRYFEEDGYRDRKSVV